MKLLKKRIRLLKKKKYYKIDEKNNKISKIEKKFEEKDKIIEILQFKILNLEESLKKLKKE